MYQSTLTARSMTVTPLTARLDLCPLMSAGVMGKGSFDEMVAKELGVEVSAIRGKDLFLVNRMRGIVSCCTQWFYHAPGCFSSCI